MAAYVFQWNSFLSREVTLDKNNLLPVKCKQSWINRKTENACH